MNNLPNILHALIAVASSGIKPAPNRNTPNTKNTTPIWSIPTLVTTCRKIMNARKMLVIKKIIELGGCLSNPRCPKENLEVTWTSMLDLNYH